MASQLAGMGSIFEQGHTAGGDDAKSPELLIP